MVRYCQIVSCENNRGIRDERCATFSVRQPERLKQWKQALDNLGLRCTSGRVTHICICMLHFHPTDIVGEKRLLLRKGAIPSLRSRPMPSFVETNAIEPSERETSEMQSNESRTELINRIETKPTELNSNVDLIVPRFTYNRKKSNQTPSVVPVVKMEANQVELQQPIKLEKPNESNANPDPLTCIENRSQTQFPQNAERSCMRCSTLSMKETQLKADIDEFRKKCQRLRTENVKFRAKIQRCTANALSLGQIIRYQRCELCSNSVTAEQLREHLCVGLTEIACEYCTDAKFTSTLAVSEHLTSGIHANMKFYKCSKCSLGFRMNALLKIHEKNHEQANGTDTNTWYKCSKCNESADQPLELVRHFKKYHPKEPRKSTSTSFYECYICKCPLDCLRTVRQHLKQHVTARDTKCVICTERFTSDELMQWHVCGSGMERSQIACEYCDESFESVAKCMQHLKTTHANDRSMYQCRTCPRYFGMERLRDFHENLYPHPTKLFLCDICSKSWTSKGHFEQHLKKVHIGDMESSFLCSECGKCFPSHRNLRLHMTLHKEPTIQCPDCPAKFHNKNTFRAHHQWHQNLTFKCNKCSRTYSKKISLQMHINKVHKKVTNVKKYECSFCDFKFDNLRSLRQHIISHTGERSFECEVCHKSYRYKGDLMKHMQTHVGDNLYKCDVCGRGFRYHADMKRHKFDHYKEDKEKHEAAQRASTNVEE